MRQAPSGFVVDANVLIDYAKSDLAVLALLSRVIARVHVPDAVLAKVTQVEVSDCDELGLRVVQPNLDQLLEAGEKAGRLADDDWLCLIVARDNGWACITNDRALRAECGAAAVELLWGLEPMLALVSIGELAVNDAEAVAWRIHESNPAFVTSGIVTTCASKLRSGTSAWPHTRR